MRNLKLPATGLLIVGLAAVTFSFARAEKPGANPADEVCQHCDCLAPDVCADREVVCPPGPDCFMPDVCGDEEVVCPPCEPETLSE